ncbi:hypothetical protein EYF80_028761 [Liparis tanakae]|uniref:Uncharacterized protein n=1 Tax=Liparis tanakae TaxID=230148 RepID=A0A4Z2H7K3_9TELE|nr:hypothetical protein EYF80_028761 [Liparis tanakae]
MQEAGADAETVQERRPRARPSWRDGVPTRAPAPRSWKRRRAVNVIHFNWRLIDGMAIRFPSRGDAVGSEKHERGHRVGRADVIPRHASQDLAGLATSLRRGRGRGLREADLGVIEQA